MGRGSLSGGLCPEGSLSGESLSMRVSGGRPHPPVNRMTDTSKNITFPQTSFAGGNKRSHHHGHYVWIHGLYFCHDPGMSVLQIYQLPWAVRVRSRTVGESNTLVKEQASLMIQGLKWHRKIRVLFIFSKYIFFCEMKSRTLKKRAYSHNES